MKKWKYALLFTAVLTIIIYMDYRLSIPLQDIAVTGNPDTFCRVIVPASENEGIYTDIQGFIKDNTCILFLPCQADISSIVYYSVDDNDSYITRYETDFTQNAGLITDMPVICMQSNLPTLEIITDDTYGTMQEVESDPEHNMAAFGDMFLSAPESFGEKNGVPLLYESKDTDHSQPNSLYIKGRGNVTWLEDKKPYLLALEDSASLLGLPKGKKWALLANVTDHSLLRNEVFLNLANDMKIPFTPKLQPVDLFINGEYKGNYSLCSKPGTINRHRIAIDEEEDFLYRIGIESGNCRPLGSKHIVKTDDYVELLNGYGDERDDEAFSYAIEAMAEIEDETSPLTHIDIKSLARYYWIQEFSKNTDAALRSVYMYRDHRDEKLHFICAWDFDRTAGTIDRFEEEGSPSLLDATEDADYLYPTGWCVRNRDWFIPLFKHEEFVKAVNDTYVDDGLSDLFAHCVNEIPARISNIQASADMNFMRWDYLTRPLEGYYNLIEKYMGDTSYNSETTWLTEWLRQRAEFIEESCHE